MLDLPLDIDALGLGVGISDPLALTLSATVIVATVQRSFPGCRNISQLAEHRVAENLLGARFGINAKEWPKNKSPGPLPRPRSQAEHMRTASDSHFVTIDDNDSQTMAINIKPVVSAQLGQLERPSSKGGKALICRSGVLHDPVGVRRGHSSGRVGTCRRSDWLWLPRRAVIGFGV